MQTQTNETSSSTIDTLRRMADEIRVKIHLAGMEAKDAWNELEPKLRGLEQRAETATTDVLDDLRERMSKLLERVRGH
jgi:hypothetical protein